METYDLDTLKSYLPQYVAQFTQKRDRDTYNCPFCGSGTGRKGTPAFGLYDDNTKFKCHSCGVQGTIIDFYLMVHHTGNSREEIAQAIKALSKEFNLTATTSSPIPQTPKVKVDERHHIYKNADGSIFGKKVVNKFSDGSKNAVWYLFDSNTGNFNGKFGLSGHKAPLYNADLLHSNQDEPVYIVEGEKDADTLVNLGAVATTIPNGAGFRQWIPLYNEGLQGQDIIILTDNDDSGKKYGGTVARNTLPIAKSVKIIPATAIWDKCPEKGDISDIVQAVGEDKALELLIEAIQRTNFYIPEQDTSYHEPISNTDELEYMVKRLSDVKPEPVKFIWYPYIPVGEITIMFAAGGTGKSFLTCGIAADITAGRSLPNPYESQTTATPQNVLIISAEDTENILHQRLVAAGADTSRCFTIAPPNQQDELEKYQQFELPCDAHDKKHIDALKKAIHQYQARLIVIDPWSAYVGKDTDMNRANSVRAITAELTVIAKEMDCAFLIVAHVNKKAQADNANDAVAGSADLINGARSALAVRTFDDVEDRIMIHTKCNYEALGKSICYKIINQGKGKTGKFEWNGFCNITKEDLEDSARSGKRLKDIADDKNDEEENKRIAIDIITQLAVFGKRVNVTYIRFRKLIHEQCGSNFLPHRPTRFMNSLLSELRTRGITLENVGSRIRDDFPDETKGEAPFAGFTICCMTDGHLTAEAMPR